MDEDEVYYCCVRGCGINTKEHNVNMFKMPWSLEKRAKWANLIGRPDLLNHTKPKHRICEDHFAPEMIDKKNKLSGSAIPCFNLPSSKATTKTETETRSSPRNVSVAIKREPEDTTAVFALQKELAEMESSTLDPDMATSLCFQDVDIKMEPQDIEEENMVEIAETEYSRSDPDIAAPSCSQDRDIRMGAEDTEKVFELEKEIAEMEDSTVTMLKQCQSTHSRLDRSNFMDTYQTWHNDLKLMYQGYEYRTKYRLHCLNVYCKAPKAYPMLKKTFSLPSSKKLKSTKLNLRPGTNKNFIYLVGRQLQHIPKSNPVIVCLEEIDLMKHLYYDIRHDDVIGLHDIDGDRQFEGAKTAFVISIKGCLVNYRQMIGYCFAKTLFSINLLSNWLDDTIRSLFDADLQVSAIFSMQSTLLVSLAKFKGVSAENPYFEVYGEKIYYIFDLAQMINGIRDSLSMSRDFVYKDDIISWYHLQILYQTEMDRRIRLVPQLTDYHLNPNRAKRNQLQLTREVFSYNVAAVMSAEIDEARLPPEAQGTVEFFIKMNNFINICSRSKTDNLNLMSMQSQIACLSETLEVFEKIRVINKMTGRDEKDDINCFRGIILSIKAVLHLYENCSKSKLKQLKTIRLMSEKMFSNLLCNGKKPKTAIQVKRSFCALALSHLIKNSTLGNYKGNLDELILADENVNDFSLLEEYIPNAPRSSPLAVGTTDYRFELVSKCVIQHICSYLFKKCSSIHMCAGFKKYLEENKPVKKGRAEKQTWCLLGETAPPSEFMDFVRFCDNSFMKYFNGAIVAASLASILLQKSQQIGSPFNPCPCFPQDFLIKLFLRIRIYNIIKFRNKRFKIAESLQQQGTCNRNMIFKIHRKIKQ